MWRCGYFTDGHDEAILKVCAGAVGDVIDFGSAYIESILKNICDNNSDRSDDISNSN